MAELERIYKDTDSGGWGWVTQEAAGGSSVGSLVGIPGGYASAVQTAFEPVPCDGSTHNIDVPGQANDWLDASGNITAPGLYLWGMLVKINTPPTTSGLYMRIPGPFNGDWIHPLDALMAQFGGVRQFVVSTEFQSLALGDFFPYPTDVSVQTQADATAVLDVAIVVSQLAAWA